MEQDLTAVLPWVDYHSIARPVPDLLPCFPSDAYDQEKIQYSGPVTFWYGSGSEDPYRWLTDPALFVSDLQFKKPTKNIFFLVFFAYYVLTIHIHRFSRYNVKKKPQNSRSKGFLLFSLNDGRIRIRASLTNGSGSRRSKNIRIRNTGNLSFFLQASINIDKGSWGRCKWQPLSVYIYIKTMAQL